MELKYIKLFEKLWWHAAFDGCGSSLYCGTVSHRQLDGKMALRRSTGAHLIEMSAHNFCFVMMLSKLCVVI